VPPTSWPQRLVARAPRIVFEAFFASITLYSARPAFASLHLPLQDIPQHMAAISVLRRYPTDAGLRHVVELTLSRTQYLFVYLLGVPLSIPFGVAYATRLLVAMTVVSIPYALRFALRRSGGDERLAALAWPFAWNPQMMFGFLNFLLGIPLALVAIGLFNDRERRTNRRRRVVLALLALAAFYSHLIPYGILGLGVLLSLHVEGPVERLAESWRDASRPLAARALSSIPVIASLAWSNAKRWTRELLFLLPSFAAAILWVARSPARDASVRAGGIGQEVRLTWPDRMQLPAQFRETILAVQGDSDEKALIAWGLALFVAFAATRTPPRIAVEATAPATRVASHRLAWLPFVCALLYVFTPDGYGWIWPIHTRFAVAAVLLLPLALGRIRHGVFAWAILLAMAWAAIGVSREQTVNFQRWDRDEFGDLDAALVHARPGRRLIALVPAMRSQHIPSNVPLLHAAAYYQVRGGVVATFSFADFPQSPFRYREAGPRPPRLRPRWEWETSLRDADATHTYYDYVLTRGGWGDEPSSFPDIYDRIYQGPHWNLYERRR